MKKLSFFSTFLIAIILFAFIAPQLGAQGIVGVKTYNLGTVTNSVDEDYVTGDFSNLIKEFGCNKIDSLVVALTVKNETDIDSLDFYPCNWTTDGTKVLGPIIHYTVTLNIAAAGTGTQILYTSNHGVQPTSLRGYEGYAILTRGAAAGNDPTDPNSCKLSITFFGS